MTLRSEGRGTGEERWGRKRERERERGRKRVDRIFRETVIFMY